MFGMIEDGTGAKKNLMWNPSFGDVFLADDAHELFSALDAVDIISAESSYFPSLKAVAVERRVQVSSNRKM